MRNLGALNETYHVATFLPLDGRNTGICWRQRAERVFLNRERHGEAASDLPGFMMSNGIDYVSLVAPRVAASFDFRLDLHERYLLSFF